MNDIKSLLIATTVLAIGGLGLYMYKSEENELDYNDDLSDSDSGSETASESESVTASELEELDYDDYKPKKAKKEGTKKNIKKNGGTRKKY
jgi:hypothetical protein